MPWFNTTRVRTASDAKTRREEMACAHDTAEPERAERAQKHDMHGTTRWPRVAPRRIPVTLQWRTTVSESRHEELTFVQNVAEPAEPALQHDKPSTTRQLTDNPGKPECATRWHM